MRGIPQDIKKTILSILPSELTEAIYIFGSFGTDCYIKGRSDLDIGWFTNQKVDIITYHKLKEVLEQKLNIEIDLKMVNKFYPPVLINEILNGERITPINAEMEKYINNFYYQHYNDLISYYQYMDGGYDYYEYQ
jgi:predicted nucleotidyltransferase